MKATFQYLPIVLVFHSIYSSFQLYVELAGPEQPDSVPDTIYLQIRHLSESFFRAGDGNHKEYRQPLGNNRTINFKRLAIIDEARCRQKEQSGVSKIT